MHRERERDTHTHTHTEKNIQTNRESGKFYFTQSHGTYQVDKLLTRERENKETERKTNTQRSERDREGGGIVISIYLGT